MKRVVILLPVLFFVMISCGERPMHIVEGKTPQLISSLVGEITNLESASEQDAYMEEWKSTHADSLFPISTETENGYYTSFLYYQSSEEAVSRVTLGLDANEYDRDAIELHRADDSNLFYGTVLFSDPEDMQYCYYIYEDKDSRGNAEKDPFNKNIVYDTVIRSVIKMPDSESGYLQYLKGIVPETGITNISKRDIYVYLPPDYYTSPEKNYPVLYMQDGQNIWDSDKANYGGWKMDSIASELILSNEIEPLIIIGIENDGARRNFEYVGWSTYYGQDDPADDFDVDDNTRMGLAFEDFVVNEVVPLIESKYRAKEGRDYTGIGGSSYGAGVSLFIAFRNPDSFSKVAALSGGNRPYDHPVYPQKPYFVYPYLIDNVINSGADLKIYMDCGDRDLDEVFLDFTLEMKEALLDIGFSEGDDLYYRTAEGDGHNERAWAERVPTFLEYLFPAEE